MAHLDLFHRTTPEAAAAIVRDKRMTSKERGDVFFSTKRDGGQAEGYGNAVVHVRVPEHLAELDDEFPDGEQHYKVNNRHLKPHHFVGARVTTDGGDGAQPSAPVSNEKDAHRLRFDHKDWETGGSKWPTEARITAVHPDHGAVGFVQYLIPRRSNGPHRIQRLEVDPKHTRKGYGTALMDDLQARHPKARIDHGDRTNAGKEWWDAYGKGKANGRGRTAATRPFGEAPAEPSAGWLALVGAAAARARLCAHCGGTGELPGGQGVECGVCDGAGRDSRCGCGRGVELDPLDGWQHVDGSVGHDRPDEPWADLSVADTIRTIAGGFAQRGRVTNWDEHPEAFDSPIHRGVSAHIPAELHEHVSDPSVPLSERAHALMSHVQKSRPGLGMSWSSDHYTARNAADVGGYGAGRQAAPGGHEDHRALAVVFHGAPPQRHHVETDPGKLAKGDVWHYEHGNQDEVPIKAGAPVHITGISWEHQPLHRKVKERWVRHDFPSAIQATAYRPTRRLFGPTYGLDKRLFSRRKLRPDVARYVLGTLDGFWRYRHGGNWRSWARVYLAGSEASEWTGPELEGNNDFDVLVGIHYDAARAIVPGFAGMTDQAITDTLNGEFRGELIPRTDPVDIVIDGRTTGPWSNTWYVNPDSWDIRAIKPYAAYDVTNDRWAVTPPHLPEWSIDAFPEGHALIDMGDAYDDLIKAILALPEPYRTQQGNALWEHLHGDRSRAFSPQGEGWFDPANVIEKWLDQEGTWAQLFGLHQRAHDDPSTLLAPAGWSNDPRT